MENLFDGIYKNKIVLITGHTGFKGSWLTLWLLSMGAKVIGYSKDVPTKPSHYELIIDNGELRMENEKEENNSQLISVFGDIRDSKKLDEVFEKYKPDIVFHLAAQPLVRYSYENPIETYETNVIGTLKVFETCKKHSVKAIVNITSDKCYENKELIWGYREIDPMGGYDPYSSSKGCAELLTSSYRNSYFNLSNYGKTHHTLLASCRAGNVIGGGDWAEDRLIPDIVKVTSKGEMVTIRNPQAIRPWQHVLEPLSGYLQIGQKLLEEKKEFAQSWNFGPKDDEIITVEEVVNICKQHWKEINLNPKSCNLSSKFHEANLLKLDCSKAYFKLKWKNVWNTKKTFEYTVNWYKKFYQDDLCESLNTLINYIKDAKNKGTIWAK